MSVIGVASRVRTAAVMTVIVQGTSYLAPSHMRDPSRIPVTLRLTCR